MNKFLATFILTYNKKIKSKSFLIITLLLMTLIALLFNTDKMIKLFDPPKNYIVVTEDENIYKNIEKIYKENENDIRIVRKTDLKKSITKLKQNKIDNILYIKVNDENNLIAKVYDNNTVSVEEKQKLQEIIAPLQQSINAKKLNISLSNLQKLNQTYNVQSVSLNKKITNNSESNFKFYFSYTLIILLIFIIMNYVNQISVDIAHEKTTRVIEMVITSIQAEHHILAKILGVISVALTQTLILIITSIFCYNVFDGISLFEQWDIKFTNSLMIYIFLSTVVWILGIISYIILGAIIGATISRMEDIGQAMIPISILLLGSFYIVLFNMSNPFSNIIKIMSFIPYSSPFATLLKLSSNNYDYYEIIAILFINLFAILSTLYLAANNYKNSILNFNNPKIAIFKKKK